MRVDVAVIGGGIAGVSVAAELAGLGRVVVLEREPQLGMHATGRSAATYLECYGSAQIRALTKASRPTLAAQGLLAPRPQLLIAGESDRPLLAALLAQEPSLRAAGADEVLRLCAAIRPEWAEAAAIEVGAADLDVAGLLQYYRARARSGGVEFRTNSAVIAARISGDEATGAVWRLSCADAGAPEPEVAGSRVAGEQVTGEQVTGEQVTGEQVTGEQVTGEQVTGAGVSEVRVSGVRVIEAGMVVNAAGAWADEVALVFGAPQVGLRPLRRTIAVVTSDAARPDWPLVVDAADRFYLRPEGTGLLISPADETLCQPGDVRPEMEDIALGLARINEATTLNLRHVRTSWAGLRTFAPDRNPVVGFDPVRPGLFWLAGQGGYGMQTAPALAQLAAALVAGSALPHWAVELVAAMAPDRFHSSQGQA